MAQNFEFNIATAKQYEYAKEKVKLLSKENPHKKAILKAIEEFEWMNMMLPDTDNQLNKIYNPDKATASEIVAEKYAAYTIEAQKLKEAQKKSLSESIQVENLKALKAKHEATKAALASMSGVFGGYSEKEPAKPSDFPSTVSYAEFLDFINGYTEPNLQDYQKEILSGLQSSPTPKETMIKKATKPNSIAADLGVLMAQLLDAYKKVSDPQFLAQLNEHICAGTNHMDIQSYHADFSVPLVQKVQRYCEVIAKIQNRKNDLGKMLTSIDLDAQETIDKQVQFIQSLDAKLQKMSTQLEELVVVNSQLKHQLQEEQKQKVHVTNIMLHDKVTFTLNTETEKHHKQLMQLFNYLRARNHEGFSEFLWVDGAPGSGKTRIGRTLAKMLGVGFYPRPADPTVTSNKLTGFNNLLNGSFVEGWFYKPFKDGGLLALDEGDLMDASCFAGCNSIENSEYTFGNGELIQRHKDFYLIVFANTRGQGAQRGFQRNKLDAATLDRFTMVELEYDEKMEQEVYGDPEWAQYVQKVREDVKKNVPGAVYITPRATRKGAAYLAQGMEPAEVALNTIFKLCSEDTRNAIIQRVGVFMRKSADTEKLTGVFALNTEAEFDPHSRDALWNKMPGAVKLWVTNLIKQNSGTAQQNFMKICTKFDKHERLLALLYYEFRCYVVNGQHNYWMHGDYAKELCNHPQLHAPEMSHGFVQEFVCGLEENQTKGWMYSYTKPRVKVKKTVSGDWVPDNDSVEQFVAKTVHPAGQPIIDLTGESYLGTNLKSIADELYVLRMQKGISNMDLIERIHKMPDISLEMKGTILQNVYWHVSGGKFVLTNEYVSYIFNNVTHFNSLMHQWGDSFQDIDTKTESMGIIHRNPVNPTAHKV